MLQFNKRFHRHKTISHSLILLLLGLFALPALWILYSGNWSTTSDGDLHLMRLTLLDHYIRQGFLYPRWIPDLFLGHGYPLFNYYAPSVYYLAECFHLTGLNIAQAWLATGAVLVWTAAYGMYLFARDFFTEGETKLWDWTAIVVAIAYIYAPYLLSNLYIRGAFPELAAQMLLPWLFWAFRRIFTASQPASYIPIAAFSLAGIAITHNITLLILPPILLAYLLLLAWQSHRGALYRCPRLGWSLVAIVVAMGLSLFFWLPMIMERSYLARDAYTTEHLPAHLWNLKNFLDIQWRFDYQGGMFKLGMVQLMMGMIGFLLAKKRKSTQASEWHFWLIILLLSAIGISNLSLSFWSSHELLQIVQFPWRLLTLISFALAIFTGGIVQRLSWTRYHGLGSLLVVTIIISGSAPQIDRLDTTYTNDISVDLEAIARYEVDANALGAGWNREFLPRWAENFTLGFHTTSNNIDSEVKLEVLSAGPYHFLMNTASTDNSSLHLHQFYFPGWQATLDGDRPLEPYPMNDEGLFTVDIPSGEHQLEIVWAGTSYQKIGDSISQFTVLIFLAALFWWADRRQRWGLMVGCSTILLLFALYRIQTKPLSFQQPIQDISESGIELLGYQKYFLNPHTLFIFPYWHVQSVAEELGITWQLISEGGVIESETHSTPYFDTTQIADWTPNTIVRDAYQLILPDGLSAGTYQLAMHFGYKTEPLSDKQVGTVVDKIVLAHNITMNRSIQETNIQFIERGFSGKAWLDGFEIMHHPHFMNQLSSIQQNPHHEPLTIVEPGDSVELRLHWRAEEPLSANYHSFLHLVDRDRQTLTAQDQLPGIKLNSPRLWNRYRARSDTYIFKIPYNARGGLYWPRVGLYRYEDKNRLDIYGDDGILLGDGFDLPAFKIYSSSPSTPLYAMSARFGRLAEFVGYDLIHNSNEEMLLTLHYTVLRSEPRDYKRFVHLYHPDLGMAAQFDSWPQNGGNPTSLWLANEIIADPVVLQLSENVTPGTYRLVTGFYDPQTGERVEVFDADNNAYIDRLLPLTEIEVMP